MPPPDLLSDRQQHALVEAVALMSSVFWGPSRESCGAMMNGEFLEPFRTLSRLLPAECGDALRKIEDVVSTHPDPDSLYDFMETAFVRHFVSDRGGISAPLYESCYTDAASGGEAGQLMGAAAIDMKRRLESAGLSMGEKIAQMSDHLSVQMEYLYFLIHGRIHGGDDLLEKAIRSFAGDVMLPWVRKFCQKLDRSGKEDVFYPLMARLLTALLELVSGADRFWKKESKPCPDPTD